MIHAPRLTTGVAYEAEVRRRVSQARCYLARMEDAYEREGSIHRRMCVTEAREHLHDQFALAEEFGVRGNV